ncbi:MAG TPA: alanine--glyoxylate aminotransferase family protein [Bacteroidales bacterium]|nr:alanine--glyoxylate aminotransferase family protein [Bacteroidales bacterium]
MKKRKLLMIPGPIEFEPAVLQALGEPTTSHVAPDFISIFGQSLDMMREVWQAPAAQPFILAGSGTLAMDSAGANMIEPGDNALVISTGYFGDRYANLLERYGANVNILKSELGATVSDERIEAELQKGAYKVLTFTHVDTSTAVKVDPRAIGKLGRRYGVVTILDGVCSVAGEEIRQAEWGIDIVLTASQKAIGVPPGLALLMVSPEAMEVWKNRKTAVGNYYADWNNWLPIMEAYKERRPSYFATPAVNLVASLKVSLEHIIEEGMDARFKRHMVGGKAFRAAFKSLGLSQIPLNDNIAANTLSAPYFPDGINGQDLLSAINRAGVITAGGLLPGIKDKYFRIGHMGAVSKNDIIVTISAIESGLSNCGYSFEQGSGLVSALSVLNNI